MRGDLEERVVTTSNEHKCCGEDMEIFGVNDKGLYKYYCNVCHNIETHDDEKVEKGEGNE
jgi:hypothetical protein